MIPFIDIILHTNEYLSQLIGSYGLYVYVILFAVIFVETGFVVMPFLPGDSLLFAVGALAAVGQLSLGIAIFLLIVAAVLGDSLNYYLGKKAGQSVFQRESSFFFNKKHLLKTQLFYEKHGGKAVTLARFFPFIRTFAPFVAGIGQMNYTRFLFFNVLGAILWVSVFILGGFFFGKIPFVQENFSAVIIGIIAFSIVPFILKFAIDRIRKKPIELM